MKGQFKKGICLVLTLALTLAMSVSPVSQAKKKSPKLNKSKLTLKVGKTYKLKVKNTKKKVKWSIKTGKKNIKLTKKKKASVVIKAKKKGSATVIAKIGKKKLKCKVTVKKADNPTPAPTSASTPTPTPSVDNSVKLQSVTIPRSNMLEVQLSAAQALTKENFTLKCKQFPAGNFIKTLDVKYLSTSDNKTYYLQLDEYLYAGEIVQVTITGLTGSKTMSKEATFLPKNGYHSTDTITCQVNTSFETDFILAGSGHRQIKSVELDDGVNVKLDEVDNKLYFTGTIKTTGKSVNKIFYIDELGNEFSATLTILVYDDSTLVASCNNEETTLLLLGGNPITSHQFFYASGGSGSYTYTVSDKYDAQIVDNEYIQATFDAVGDYTIPITVVDEEDSSLTTTFYWVVHVKTGYQIPITILDANNEEIFEYADVKLYSDSSQENFSSYSNDTTAGKHLINVPEGVYTAEVSCHATQKTFLNKKIAKDTSGLTFTLPVRPITITSDDLETSVIEDMNWYDENDKYVGAGSQLYLEDGTHALTSTLVDGLTTYRATTTVTVKAGVTTAKATGTATSSIKGTITPNSFISTTLTAVDQYYTFTPTTSGTYRFYSSGEGDSYGSLYDSNLQMLTYNDDSDDATGNNFSFSYDCTAGETYYIAIRAYGQESAGPAAKLWVNMSA